MTALRDNFPLLVTGPPPLGEDGTMHMKDGLRWCISVADNHADLSNAADLLSDLLNYGATNGTVNACQSLFDDFRERWADVSFECQRLAPEFDFRAILASSK